MSGVGVDGQDGLLTWSLDWSYTVHLESGPVVFNLNRILFEGDNPHVESLIDEMREEEQEKKDDDDDFDPTEMYVAFETNHPLAAKRRGRGEDNYSEREQQQAAARIVRKYGSRWGIENGFKKRGHFLPRTASPNHVLRFFGFIFAATLYNAWRLVDILVKLSVEDDPMYTPLVTASRFMAVLEGHIGLKPPPD